MEFVIGSLNCLNYGRGSSKKKDVSKFAQIIRDEKFDIIALQEIKHPYIVKYIVDSLNNMNSYGPWKGVADGEVNDYAYIWNSKRVDKASTLLQDGKERVFQPHIFKQYKLERRQGQIPLIRNPYYARFHTVIPGIPKIEFRLLNTHIRYTKASSEQQSDITSLGAAVMRRNELSVLENAIYPKVSSHVYGSKDAAGNPLTAYTIILGDYNLNLRGSGAGAPYILVDSFTINTGKRDDIQIRTFQTELTTLKKPQPESSETGENDICFVSNYDHFTYDENRFNGTDTVCERVDSVARYFENRYEEHYEKLSDHVPIKLTINTKKG